MRRRSTNKHDHEVQEYLSELEEGRLSDWNGGCLGLVNNCLLHDCLIVENKQPHVKLRWFQKEKQQLSQENTLYTEI